MAIDELLNQIKKGKEQQAISGNPNLNRGQDEALYGAYFYADVKQKAIQRQQDIQQNQFNQTLGFNKDVQANQEYQWGVNQKNAKDAAKQALIGSAVGGAAQLGMQAYGMNKQSDMINTIYGNKTPYVTSAINAPRDMAIANEPLPSNFKFEEDLEPSWMDGISNWGKGAYDWLTTW